MTVFELADRIPDAVAVVDERRSYSWLDVDDMLSRVADGLSALDLGPHRRVAVFAENATETLMAHLGSLLASASSVPVNYHLAHEEAAYILADSRARLLFVDASTAERGLRAARTAQREGGSIHIIGWDVEHENITPWKDWLASASPLRPRLDAIPRPSFLYTSGTTGRPKGTDFPPAMFLGGATMAEHLERLKTNRFAPFGTHLVVGPMYHTGPLNGMRLLVCGVPLVILNKFDARKTLRAIHDHRIETSVMVPTHFIRLLALDKGERSEFDVSSISLVSHTGAPCPIAVKRKMIDWWGPVFIDAYGATEVGTTCQITSQEWLDHPGSVGRPLAPFSVRILDDEGRDVPIGEEGRVFFSDATGRGIVYPNDSEASRRAHIEPGVFTLGEIGYVDEDGYVYLTDRSSDMIVSGGVNIYPAEAEQILIEHPAIADVACIGVPHEDLGEHMLALVIVRASDVRPDTEEILEFCRSRLSHFKCPRKVEFVEDLGRTAMGKINKRLLRAPYWHSHEHGPHS